MVITVIAVKLVAPNTAIEDVVIRSPMENVIAPVAIEDILSGAAPQGIITISTVERVVAVFTVDLIITLIGMNNVVTCSGMNGVSIHIAKDLVGLRGTSEGHLLDKGIIPRRAIAELKFFNCSGAWLSRFEGELTAHTDLIGIAISAYH